MSLEDRFSSARTELDTMFSNTDVPSADGVRRRHVRRRAMQGTLAGLAALMLVFGTAAVVSSQNNDDPVIADDSSVPEPTTPTTEPAPPTTVPETPTTTVAPVGPTAHPAGLVGATADGRIVEINENGSVGRELVNVGAAVAEMQIVGDTLFYRAEFDESCSDINRVPLTGGESEVISSAANTFAVSPEGKYLAYFSPAACGAAGGTGGNLTIRDMETQESVVWATPETSDDFFEVNSNVSHLAWSPDGTLAATWCYEGCAIQLIDDFSQGGTFTYADTIEGETPAFVDGVMWATRSYYPEPFDEPVEILRYDSLGSDPVAVASPFTTHLVTELLAGRDGTLLGVVGGGFTDVPLRIEPWTPGSPTMDGLEIDDSIQTVTIH